MEKNYTNYEDYIKQYETSGDYDASDDYGFDERD